MKIIHTSIICPVLYILLKAIIVNLFSYVKNILILYEKIIALSHIGGGLDLNKFNNSLPKNSIWDYTSIESN